MERESGATMADVDVEAEVEGGGAIVVMLGIIGRLI